MDEETKRECELLAKQIKRFMEYQGRHINPKLRRDLKDVRRQLKEKALSET